MRLAGSVTVHTVPHLSLAGNALGDPADRQIPVYRPPDFTITSRYPVVYYLPGYSGSSLSPLNISAFEPNLIERFDRAVVQGVLPPSLLVVADGFTRLGGSQYINSPVNGNYADAIADDLVNWVDAHEPTKGDRAFRAVVGKSSGGFGALHFGMKRSDRFGLVVSHSGDTAFDYSYRSMFPKAARSYRRYGGVEGYLTWLAEQDTGPGNTFEALEMIAMSTAYSPNLDAPGLVDLPFDIETCDIRQDIWDKWLAHDPVRMVAGHSDALKTLSLLWIDCGTRDEFNLDAGARMLAARLRTAGVPHHHEEFDGGHMGVTYRIEQSLKAIGANWGNR